IRLELLLDIPWQRSSLGCPLITKVRIVLGDEPIEQRGLGLVAAVARRRNQPLCLRKVVYRRAHCSHPCDALKSPSVGVRLGLCVVSSSTKGSVMLSESAAMRGFAGMTPAPLCIDVQVCN